MKTMLKTYNYILEYLCLHIVNVNIKFINNDYVKGVNATFGDIIIEIYVNLNKDGFIDLKRPLVLIVTKQSKLNGQFVYLLKTDSNKRYYSTMLNLNLNSKRMMSTAIITPAVVYDNPVLRTK